MRIFDARRATEIAKLDELRFHSRPEGRSARGAGHAHSGARRRRRPRGRRRALAWGCQQEL